MSTNVEGQFVSPNDAKPRVSRSLFMNCYRVVSDTFGGYEAQVKFWWFPFYWFEMIEKGYMSNTWRTLEEAQNFIVNGSKQKEKKKRKIYWVSQNCG